jgi:plastin-1
MMEDIDTDDDGKVTFEEFCKLMAGKGSAAAAVRGATGLTRVTGAVGSHTYAVEERMAFAEHLTNVLQGDEYLSGRGVFPISGDDDSLFTALKDGLVLCKFINCAVPDTVYEKALNYPKEGKELNPWETKENLNTCINAAKSIGCSIVNIHADDIMRTVEHGREYLVLGMVWQIVKIQLLASINLKETPELVKLLHDGEELADLIKLPPEDVLLRWLNYHLENAGSERRVKNFSGDLKDSEVYTIVLNQIDGEVCDTSALDMSDKTARARKVIENAKSLDVPAFVKPADITSGQKRLNLAFCAQIFNTNHGLRLDEEEAERVKAEFEAAGLLDDDESDNREERVFRMWMNSLDLDNEVYVTNLYEGINEGTVMLEVIDKVSPGIVEWKRVNKTKMNRYKRLENNNYAVNIGKELKMSLVGIGGVDILDKNKKLILAFVWQLMRRHVIRMLEELSGDGKEIKDADILSWANGKVEEGGSERRATSFKDKSLKDGLFFLDLLRAVEPRAINEDLVTDGEDEDGRMMNAKYVIAVARKLGCLVFLTWEDITDVKPKMLMTLTASIMHTAMSYSAE